MVRARRALTVLTVVLLVMAGVAVTGTIAGQSDSTMATNDSNWDAPRADDGRSGARADDGPGPNGTFAWSAASDGTFNSGVVADGQSVYAAWNGPDYPAGVVRSMKLHSGLERRRTTEVGNPLGSPTVDGDRLYVATVGAPDREFDRLAESQTGMYALNASTGDVVWRHNETFSEPVLTDDRLVTSVYAAEDASHTWEARESGGESVTALAPETGNRTWTTNVSGSVLAAANGTVYVGSEAEDTLSALPLEDGSVQWQTSVADDTVLDDSVAATADSVYLGSQQRTFDEWTQPEGTQDPTMTAYAATDGEKRWTTTLSYTFSDEEPAYATAPAVADGHDAPRRGEP
ncbi:PQQ-binding-like beta-propeller repeat protein [Halobacteriales archaeon Cl-PHB]